MEVPLTMFELVLFNKHVIKLAKSGPILAFRSSLYSFFEKIESVAVNSNMTQLRLYYCMMYNAFEI